MGDPIGTYLMPLYAVASWYGLYAHGDTGSYNLPVALVGWVWAGINVLRTRQLDLGVVSFFLVLLASLGERRRGLTPGIRAALCGASAIVAANFALPLLFWRQIRKIVTKGKSDTWTTTFLTY